MRKSPVVPATLILAMALATAGHAGIETKAAGTVALPVGWSAPENASNTAAWSQTPVAALDASGAVYVVWDEWYGELGDRRDVMFNTNRSGIWGAPRANTLQYNLINEVGFPEVAVTRSGADAVYAWMDRDLSRDRMVIDWDELTDGTWTGLKWVSDQIGDSSRRVTVAASPVDGTVCLVWEQNTPAGINLIYQYRDGATGRMSAPELISPGQADGQFLPSVCVDGRGTAHVAYSTGGADAVIWYTKNADPKNLRGWTAPIALSGGTGTDRPFAKVAAADDGDAYVVWYETRGGNAEIYLRFQVNGVWQATVVLTQTPLYSEYPSVAVNPASKDIYVSWSETPDNVTANIMVKTFEADPVTGARAWSGDYLVDANNASEQSCIRVTREGDIHLLYAEGGEIRHIQRLVPKLAAVAAPTVTTRIDHVLFAARKYITVAFDKNPANDDATLREYRLYAKKIEEPDAAYAVLATFVPADALSFVHKKIPMAQRYVYVVGVVNKAGLELKSGATISD